MNDTLEKPPEQLDCFVGNANGRGLIRLEGYQTGVHIASMPRGAQSEAYAAEICRRYNAHANLLAALENLLTYDRVVRPAFRSKPVGAPNSSVRIDQDKLIALEDAALAAIARAKGATP